MKTTELLGIEQALQLVEHVLVRCGDEGEYLIPQSHDNQESAQSLAQRRLAAQKSLAAAKGLLAMAAGLMRARDKSSIEGSKLQTAASIGQLKLAARGAYRASHVLVGVKSEYRSSKTK